MERYKTPTGQLFSQNQKRATIKAEGGQAYADLLARERAARKLFRERHPEKTRASRKKYEKTRPGFTKKRQLMLARRRARIKGLEATIRVADVNWPTHCPVLGIKLDYSRSPDRSRDAIPSLDRWDNSKGYVPGNVFVISYRANTLKNNANIEELESILRYLRERPRALPSV